MQYTSEDLERIMGVKLDSSMRYVVETQRGAMAKLRNPNWKRVGEVPDFTHRDDGKMVVLSLRTPPPPKPEPVVVKPVVKQMDAKPKPVPKKVEAKRIESTKTEPTPAKSTKSEKKRGFSFRKGGSK